MKLIRRIFISIMMFTLCLSINTNDCVKAEENNTSETLTVSSSKLVLDKGEKQTITANQKVTWKSSNKKIAAVSKKGVIKVKKKGKVTITAKSIESNEKVKVTVYCGGYKITKKRFPDKGFREYIKYVEDSDGDGYLSNKERGNYALYLDTTELKGEPGGKKLCKKINKIKNLKGLEYFYNLQGITINYANGLKNIDLSNLKKLVYFEICGDKVKNVIADNCPKLVGFDIEGSQLKSIRAVNCKKLGTALGDKAYKKMLKRTAMGADNTIFISGTPTKLDVTDSPIRDENIIVDNSVQIIRNQL